MRAIIGGNIKIIIILFFFIFNFYFLSFLSNEACSEGGLSVELNGMIKVSSGDDGDNLLYNPIRSDSIRIKKIKEGIETNMSKDNIKGKEVDDIDNKRADKVNVNNINEVDRIKIDEKNFSMKGDGKSGKKERKDNKNDKRSKEDIMPDLLTTEEIIKLREEAIRYKRDLEKEKVPDGIIRSIYVDNKTIYKIRTKVNYSTVLVFPSEVKLSDITIGTDIIKVERYKDRFIVIYPLAAFKNTNMTVFYNNSTLNFIVEEEMDANMVDIRVDIHEIPKNAVGIGELFNMLRKKVVPDMDRYHSAGIKILDPSCKHIICKNIDGVLEMQHPMYIKGYKIRVAEETTGLIPVGAMYSTVYDGYYYYFYSRIKGMVKKGESYYEIY